MSETGKSRDAFARAKQEPSERSNQSTDRKDNAAPIPKPSNTRSSSPAPSPTGTVGPRHTQSPSQNREPIRATQPGISVDQTLFADDARYTDGKLLTMPGYSFMARVNDAPSKTGLEGGKLEQLVVRKDDKPVAIYNNGWVREPTTPEQKEAIHRIRNGLGDSPTKEFKGFEAGPSKDKFSDLSR